MRPIRLFSLLFLVIGLAGCAHPATAPEAPPSPPPALASAPPEPQAALPEQQEPAASSPQVPPQPLPEAAFFSQTGIASFYGHAHDGNATANGRRFDHREFTAAHPSLPFGTLVRVTNLNNGRTVTVEITDRGPHIKKRVIDISLAAARALRMQKRGITRVRVEAFRIDQAARG